MRSLRLDRERAEKGVGRGRRLVVLWACQIHGFNHTRYDEKHTAVVTKVFSVYGWPSAGALGLDKEASGGLNKEVEEKSS